MAVVFFGSLAGAAFGALTVAVRWGTDRGADPQAGMLVAVAVGLAASAGVAAPSIATHGLDVGPLVPFLAAGLLAPGASQILLTLAVGHAGPSRVAVLLGTAPLMSILIALTLLDEPFRVMLIAGTVLIVSGSIALARERARPERFRALGLTLALACAALFASRDNLIRWAARDDHLPPLLASTASLVAATALILLYLALTQRERLRTRLAQALPAFAPAGVALALGYAALLVALDGGKVSVVSPLNATGSLWAILLAAAVLGRSDAIGRRTVLAALLVVAGGALIGAFR
jgi:drug/metabolite transporter (DMT)-like permease